VATLQEKTIKMAKAEKVRKVQQKVKDKVETTSSEKESWQGLVDNGTYRSAGEALCNRASSGKI